MSGVGGEKLEPGVMTVDEQRREDYRPVVLLPWGMPAMGY